MAKGISLDPKLQGALHAVRTNQDEAKKFVADPKGYLTSKGVDTSGLKFGTTQAAPAAVADTAVCGSVGCVACASVG